MQSRSISTEWANHNNVACCHWWWCDGRKKSQHLNADYYDVLWWRVFGSSCYYVYPSCIIMIMAWNVFRGLTWPWLDNNGCDAALHMTLLPLIIRRRVYSQVIIILIPMLNVSLDQYITMCKNKTHRSNMEGGCPFHGQLIVMRGCFATSTTL